MESGATDIPCCMVAEDEGEAEKCREEPEARVWNRGRKVKRDREVDADRMASCEKEELKDSKFLRAAILSRDVQLTDTGQERCC
jgi:hypothetical protein